MRTEPRESGVGLCLMVCVGQFDYGLGGLGARPREEVLRPNNRPEEINCIKATSHSHSPCSIWVGCMGVALPSTRFLLPAAPELELTLSHPVSSCSSHTRVEA